MTTHARRQVTTESVSETISLGERVGRSIKGGELIELLSDVGGGKTMFVHGLVQGIGSKDRVMSPTFTVSRIYQGADVELHHFDFYRLDEPGIIAAELEESLDDKQAAVVIEWSDIVESALPRDRLHVRIDATDDSVRVFDMQALGSGSEHLLEEVYDTRD